VVQGVLHVGVSVGSGEIDAHHHGDLTAPGDELRRRGLKKESERGREKEHKTRNVKKKQIKYE
jgi:hypothetical protein